MPPISKHPLPLGLELGRLTIAGGPERLNGRLHWFCLCRCGNATWVAGANLRHRTRATRSCGCLLREWRKPSIGPILHPTSLDIAWAAGVYEGEGCASGKGPGTIMVTQQDTWILERLKALFGGSFYKTYNGSGCTNWVLCGARARGFALTIYAYLSPRRREQIRGFLEKQGCHSSTYAA